MVRYFASLAVAALFGFVAATAEDKKDKKNDQPIKGTWVKDIDGAELSFNFKSKDQLLVVVTVGDNGCTLTCKYEANKDGKVSAKVTEVKEKGDFPGKPAVGYEFKCVFKVDGETAKLSDFEADNANEAKPIVEGDYKKKKVD